MTEAMSVQLIRQLMGMWQSGDTSSLDSITADHAVYDDVPNEARFEGRAGFRRYIEHIHAWAGQVKIEIVRAFGSQDFALAEWVMSAVQDRPIPGRVLIATNRRFELKGATLIEVRDGKITRAADYIDVLNFVLRLGARVELPGGVILQVESGKP